MKQAIYTILVGLCLFVCPCVYAQGFTPSKNYQQIQYTSYSSTGLHLQTNAFDRTHTHNSIFSLQQSGTSISTIQIGTAVHPASYITHSASLTAHGAHHTFGVGAWKGQVTNVGSSVPNVDAVKHKLPFKPGNPVDVPIGNAPWLLLSLMALAYVVFLAGRVRK